MAIIKGTNAAETKIGTTGIDTIYGYDGNDSLYGRAGNDTIWAGNGADKVWGEDGDDLLRGEAGDDFIYAGNGNDTVYGGIGNDTLYGDGGTDKIYGEAGNDILKGGTGIGYLDGGAGNDQIYYDPTTDNVTKLKDYLQSSTLNGGSEFDTLNLFNNATDTINGVTSAARTLVGFDDNMGYICFGREGGTADQTSSVGTITGIEKVVVTGKGGLWFSGDMYGAGIDITGTDANDTFRSYYAADTMTGGKGNDSFLFGGGGDRVISTATDADTFEFSPEKCGEGTSTITGFNGQGVAGGDVLKLDMSSNFSPLMTSSPSGHTIFQLGEESFVDVDVVGLVYNVDYFFV